MIGIDLVENKRIESALKDKDFAGRILTTNEIDYVDKFKNKVEHIAGFFCAKEAVMKALEDCDKISFKDIEILHKESGKPYAKLYGKAKELFLQKELKSIEISISQTKNFATAIALVR